MRTLQLCGGVGLRRLVRRCELGEPVGVRDERNAERRCYGRDESVERDATRVSDVERVGARLKVNARHLEHRGSSIRRGDPPYELGVSLATVCESSRNGHARHQRSEDILT